MNEDTEIESISKDEINAIRNSNTSPKDSSKSKMLLVFLVLLIVAAIAAYFFGAYDSFLKQEKLQATEQQERVDKVEKIDSVKSLKKETLKYYAMPQITANLKVKNAFLRLGIVISYLGEKNEKLISEKMPVIIDRLQLFIRDLDKNDFIGEAALLKLKQAILERINNIIAPIMVNEVLIQELLVQ